MVMATLCDDVLLEIFSGLPIKYLFRLKCVSQRFNQIINSIISDLKLLPTHDHALGDLESVHGFFHFSFRSPQSIRYLSLHPQHHSLNSSIRPISKHQIVDSCDGILLLNILQTNLFSLYNPTIKKYHYILKPIEWLPSVKQNIGLAYDRSSALISNNHCQLVLVYRKKIVLGGREQYGFTVFSSKEIAWWERVDAILECESSEFVKHGQAVYFNKSLHWIRKSGDIVVFDLKENKPKIISKPRFLDKFEDDMWFGVTRGSINIVRILRTQIVVFVLLDYEKGEWGCVRIKISPWPLKSVFNGFCPVFFDGEWIVLQSGGVVKEIYSYNVSLYKWNKIGDFQDSKDGMHEYIPFIPSLAWLGCAALNNNHVEEIHSNTRFEHFWPVVLRTRTRTKTRKRIRLISQVPLDSRSKRVIRKPARFNDYCSDFSDVE